MQIEPIPEQTTAREPANSLPFPVSWWGRILYGLFVTVLPAFSFWATDLFKPEWQNGNLSSYIILLLFPAASLWFFPLLAYSIICYLLLLLGPARFSQSFVVRAGIYTGILLALHYSLVVLVYSLDSDILLIVIIWISPFLFWPAHRWAVSKRTAAQVNTVLWILALSALFISAIFTRGSTLALVLVVLTMAAPFWSFLLALRAGLWLFRNYETSLNLPRGFGLTAWLGAYLAAWRFDILKMYELYAALPPTPPPDCYIATAAARGHPQIVGARTVERADATVMLVNAQLQLFKCAELALLGIRPGWHKNLRKVYDVLGKPLARKIQHPFLADMAYLLLKPAEWLARRLLTMVIPEIDSLAETLYTK